MIREYSEQNSLIQYEQISAKDMRSGDLETLYYFDERKLVGAGTYGKVYKVLSKLDGKFYALKEIKVLNDKEGFPITALREIKFLKKIIHPNVISVHQVVTRRRFKKFILKIKAYCVMDFMNFDLSSIIKKNYKEKLAFDTRHIRSILYQVFMGLQHLHEKRILHRDIKSSNILINSEGEVKLADFGLAKFIPINQQYPKTPVVVTLSYRAPEVLFTKGNYDFKIDIWSAGCLAVELLTSYPCFNPRNESDLIKLMFDMCGSPDESSWPDVVNSEKYIQLKPEGTYQRKIISHVRSNSPNADDELIDLINKIFVLNPNQRPDANQVLKHPFFQPITQEKGQESLKEYLVQTQEENQNKFKQQQPHKSNKDNIMGIASAPTKLIKL